MGIQRVQTATGWKVMALLLMSSVLAGCGINTIPTLDEQVKAAWSQVQNQYQRRSDLIPNLVEVARKYLAHEAKTLEAVIAARNQARTAEQGAAASPLNAGALGALAGAEQALGGALGRLFALAEAYPDMDDSQLAELMARAIFVADVWGRINAER